MTIVITKLFDTYERAQLIVRNLEQAGISHNNISVVASNPDGRIKIDRSDREHSAGTIDDTVDGAVVGLITEGRFMALPGAEPVIATGWLAMEAGTIIGAGGLVDVLTNHGISKDEAEVYADGLRTGGALVAVKYSNAGLPRAEEIPGCRNDVVLSQNGAPDYRANGRENGTDLIPSRRHYVHLPN